MRATHESGSLLRERWRARPWRLFAAARFAAGLARRARLGGDALRARAERVHGRRADALRVVRLALGAASATRVELALELRHTLQVFAEPSERSASAPQALFHATGPAAAVPGGRTATRAAAALGRPSPAARGARGSSVRFATTRAAGTHDAHRPQMRTWPWARASGEERPGGGVRANCLNGPSVLRVQVRRETGDRAAFVALAVHGIEPLIQRRAHAPRAVRVPPSREIARPATTPASETLVAHAPRSLAPTGIRVPEALFSTRAELECPEPSARRAQSVERELEAIRAQLARQSAAASAAAHAHVERIDTADLGRRVWDELERRARMERQRRGR